MQRQQGGGRGLRNFFAARGEKGRGGAVGLDLGALGERQVGQILVDQVEPDPARPQRRQKVAGAGVKRDGLRPHEIAPDDCGGGLDHIGEQVGHAETFGVQQFHPRQRVEADAGPQRAKRLAGGVAAV